MYKTILLKLSGESLSGKYGHGFDFEYINRICMRIKRIHDMGVNIGIVCGGGNFMRGRDAKEMDRVHADYVGMLATVMNSLALRDTLMKLGLEVCSQSGLSVAVPMVDDVNPEGALAAIKERKVIVYGGGIGKPYCSTDTASALRAKEIGADVIVKLTNVDGVYDKDPDEYDDAIMYDKVTYDEVLAKELGIMDLEAMKICRDNDIDIIVTNIDNEDALVNIVNGKKIGTMVSKSI